MKKYLIYIFVLILIFVSIGYSHGEQVAVGLVVSFPTLYTLNSGDLRVGSNINGIFGLVNGSIEQSSLFTGNDNRLKWYIGLGLGPIIQLQFGFHSSLRIRSDLVIFSDKPPAFDYWDNKWGIFRKGIIISPIIDFNFAGSKTTEVGVGIGVYF